MLSRAWLLAFCFSCLFLIFVSRLFWLQIIEGKYLAEQISADRLLTQLVPARRGRIVDRHGEVIVDNRNVYHMAFVFADLCHPWRHTKRQAFYRFDQERLTHFIAELSLRLFSIDKTRIEEVVLDELRRNPGVAIRHQRGKEVSRPQLIAIPRSALQMKELTANQQEKVASLFEQRLISQNPRQAISEELKHQRQEDVLLINHQQLLQLSKAVNTEIELGTDFCTEALLPFMPRIHINFDKYDPKRSIIEWYLLDADHIDQAIRHLAKFVKTDADALRSIILENLGNMHLKDSIENWYFAPSAIGQQINLLLPHETTQYNFDISGLPANRERIYIIQGDSEDKPEFLDSFIKRIQANLDLEIDWLRALIEEKAERISAFRSGRTYRKKHVALDFDKTRLLIKRLSATLSNAGIPCTALEAEQHITDIRRLSDREWQGLSRHHPIPFLNDIPRRIAIGLSGSGQQIPASISKDYQNADAALPGIHITTSNGREYLFPKIASHLIGYLGRIDSNMSRDEARSIGVDPNGLRGRSGLEAQYDHLLQGSTGRLVKQIDEVSRRYRILKDKSKDPLPGQTLHTTLDIQLQQQCEYALQNWFSLAQELNLHTPLMEDGLNVGKGRAGIVVMDVDSGAILSMGSSPSYDLLEFNKNYEALQKDPTQPLLDNATLANRHPGSVVKLIVGAAGLYEGKITPSTTMECRGYMALDSRGNKILRDHASGTLNVADSIAHSSNVFFATVGSKLEALRVLSWYNRFGLGNKHAYNIPWQRPQTLPSPLNIKTLRPSEPHWNPYDTWSISIGQFIKVAPLEVVTIPAFVANGGTIVRPHLVTPSEKLVYDHVELQPSHLRALRSGMERAVTEGTVTKLRLSGSAQGIRVAAKTGTSQWGRRGNKLDHAWLIGYAPVKNPKVCFAIFVHSGTSGGRACTGIAKAVLEKYFEIYGPTGHRR